MWLKTILLMWELMMHLYLFVRHLISKHFMTDFINTKVLPQLKRKYDPLSICLFPNLIDWPPVLFKTMYKILNKEYIWTIKNIWTRLIENNILYLIRVYHFIIKRFISFKKFSNEKTSLGVIIMKNKSQFINSKISCLLSLPIFSWTENKRLNNVMLVHGRING